MTLTLISIIGSTAGSLAWYAYSATTKISFVGTSVAKSALLNAGIVDDNHFLSDEEVEYFKLTRETFDGHSIVFTSSTDGINYRVIQEYLFHSDYAINLLFPVTTQARVLLDQSQLDLYESPVHGTTTLNPELDKKHYVRLPLAFRMVDSNNHNVADQDVWLTDASVQASGQHIDQALRVFVENSQRKFLMRPADKSTTPGYTKVGGVLDLDGDGTYDYNISTHKEYYYGQFNGDLVHSTLEYGEAEHITEQDDAPYDNVNGVTNTIESTFYSKHNLVAKTVDHTQLQPRQAAFYPFGMVKPSVNSNGDFIDMEAGGATGIKITTTDRTDKVGYVTFTIFIEGWDHSVIDQAANYSFNLGLRFEVNRS